MSEIEVHISLDDTTERVGTLFRQAARGRESVTFTYHDSWLAKSHRFSLEPALLAGEGMFHPGADREIFGSIGDSAPDTWDDDSCSDLNVERQRKSSVPHGLCTRQIICWV